MGTGEQITNLEQLAKAAEDKRAVICPSLNCWRLPRPAAFVINEQGARLLRLFNSGMYLFIKDKK